MSDLISRESVLNILLYFNVPQHLEMIKKLPSVQTDLISKIQNGIKATDADDVYSCGMRNGMRWCLSLIDSKEPLYENCPSVERVGKWINHRNDDGHHIADCSICGNTLQWFDDEGGHLFCPNCGAKMEGEEQ